MNQALKNYINLNSIQGLNLIIPLISYPLIISRIGLISFGELAYLQAIFSISNVFNLFGTNYTSVKQISLNKHNNQILSNILISTFLIRLTNLFISLSIILLLNSVFLFTKDFDLLIYSVGFIAFEAFVPTWYYQGLEKMFKLSLLNLFVKLSYVLVIYFFLNESNIELVPKAMLLPTLLVSVFSIIKVFKTHCSIKYLRIRYVKIFAFKSSQLFFASLFSTLYTMSNKIIIGSYFSKEFLGIYDIADKISVALKTPIQMISKALLPNLTHENEKIKNKSYKLAMFFVVILTISSYMLSPLFVELIAGTRIKSSIVILKILILSMPFVFISLFNIDLLFVLDGRFKKIIWIRFSTFLFYFSGIFFYYIFFEEKINLTHFALLYLFTEIFTSILSLLYKR